MRANEFVSQQLKPNQIKIDIPITITIPDGNEDLTGIGVVAEPHDVQAQPGEQAPQDPQELEQDPMMIPPLQQEVEIGKASLGKKSPVIDKLTTDEVEPNEESQRPLSYK